MEHKGRTIPSGQCKAECLRPLMQPVLVMLTQDLQKLVLWEFTPPAIPRRLREHAAKWAVAFDSNLQSFVEANFTHDDKPAEVRLRDMESGEVRNSFILPTPTLPLLTNSVSRHVQLCPHDRLLVIQKSSCLPKLGMTNEIRITLSDWASGLTLDEEPGVVVVSNSKHWLAIRSDNRLVICDILNMREHFARPIEGYSWPSKLGLSASGDCFFMGTELTDDLGSVRASLNQITFGLVSQVWPDPYGIQVWDVSRQKPVLTIPTAREATFSPDGQRIATQHEGGIVRVWDIAHHTNWAAVFGLSSSLRMDGPNHRALWHWPGTAKKWLLRVADSKTA